MRRQVSPPPTERAGRDPRDGARGFWASLSTASAASLAALAGILAGGLAAAGVAARDGWADLPGLVWMVAAIGLFAGWLWWPRRREVARGRAATRRGGSRWRTDDMDWAYLPVLVAPAFFAYLAVKTLLIMTVFIPLVRLTAPGLPGSVIALTGVVGVAAAWLGAFLVWLWWPQRRRLVARQRRWRREASRRLAVIKRNGWGWWSG
jgi:MFS family permease